MAPSDSAQPGSSNIHEPPVGAMVDSTSQPQWQSQGGPQSLPDSQSSADALIDYISHRTTLVAKLLSNIIMQHSGGAQLPAWYAVNNLVHVLIPAGRLRSVWTGCGDNTDAAHLRLLEQHPTILATMEKKAASMYGLAPGAERPNTTELWHPLAAAPAHLNLITWNVQGIHDRQAALAELRNKYDPFAMVFTETKLLPKQCRKSKCRLKDIPGRGYRVFTSCCPQDNALRTMPNEPLDDSGSVLLRPRGKAGVMVAIKEEWAQDHLISKEKVPSDLFGYLLHLRIQLPASDPLHIVGVYRPNGSGSRPIRDRITSHLKGQMTAAGPSAQWLVGGDLNATQRAIDRTSLIFHPIDRQFCEDMTHLNLSSAYARPSGPAQMSFKQDRLHCEGVSSRIDDWLCTSGSTLLSSVRAVPQTEIIVAPDLDGESDHNPVMLKVPYRSLFACLPPTPPPPMPRPAALRRPFPAALLTQWSDGVRAADGPTAARIAARCERLLAGPNPVAAETYDQVFAEIDAALARAVSKAVDTFGATAPVQPSTEAAHSRKCFLPRKLGNQRKHHLKLLRLCRTVYKLVHAYSEGRLNHDQLIDNNKALEFLLNRQLSGSIGDMIFDLCEQPQLLQTHVLPGLKNLMAVHKSNMKAVTRTQKKHEAQKQRKHLQTLYTKSRRQAHKVVFGASGSNTGELKGGISAAQHPVRGLVTEPEQVRQAVDWHHRQQLAPAVPAHLTDQPPWRPSTVPHPGASPPDTFHLKKRGCSASLSNRLTRHLFDSNLRSASNNKATGTDMLPNELLKHLPDSHHDMLFWFFKICWQTGRTPLPWKHSNTVLFHKKGDVTDPANYRPIALHLTLYKLWTSVVTDVMQTYAEEVGMISDMQEGFRRHRNCSRQLRHLTSVIEDARVNRRNLFLLQVDFASAFTSIDHPRLLYIMQQLGMPPDAVSVVRDIYTDVTTSVVTAHGPTPCIPVQRGTIQGDTLSPFLFILFSEPLMRWLRVGDRGYRCGTNPAGSTHSEPGVGYADDLALLCDSIDQMQTQINKLERFCAWSGMRLAPHKCNLTGIIHGATPHAAKKANVWAAIEPLLNTVTIHGQRVQLIPPDKPFKYLGILFTLTLNWQPQFKAVEAMIYEKGEQLVQSSLSQRQKLLCEEQTIMAAVRYAFCITPYKPGQLKKLDAARARIIKAILGLPGSTSNDFIYLPTSHAGLGYKSLAPTYAQVAAESLVTSLNDKGSLGALTRSLRDRHLKALPAEERSAGASLRSPRKKWRTHRSAAMCLRQAAWLSEYGMLLDQPSNSGGRAYSAPDIKEVIEDGVRRCGTTATTEQVHDMVLKPLWRLAIHTLEQLCVQTPQTSAQTPTPHPNVSPGLGKPIVSPRHLMTWQQFLLQYPQAGVIEKRALDLLQTVVCTPQCPQHVGLFRTAFQHYDTIALRLDAAPRQIAAAHACSGETTAEWTPAWPSHVCPARATQRARGVWDRLAKLLRVDAITTYRPLTERGDALPPDLSLLHIAWGPSRLISAQHRHFLTHKSGMRVSHQIDASPNTVVCDGIDVPIWSSVRWHPTVECIAHINRLWPLSFWAYLAKTPHTLIGYGETVLDPCHHAQGVDARASLQPVPQSDPIPSQVIISAQEVNPDADIAPSGGTQLVRENGSPPRESRVGIPRTTPSPRPVNPADQPERDDPDTSHDTVGCYDAAGHLAGRLTFRRLHFLESQWRAQQEHPADGSPARQAVSLPDAVHAVMAARGIHRAPVRSGQRPLRRWQPPMPVWQAMKDAFRLQNDWFSSPLSTCMLLPVYATPHPSDAAFGAIHDAYAFKWTGSGIFNPPNSTAQASKAIRWALQSTTESSPILNVGLIPERRNMADVDRLCASDRVHQLCRIKAKSVQGCYPDYWYNSRPDQFLNDQTIRVLLVFNETGLAKVQPDVLQALHTRLLTTGAKLLDWDASLPPVDVPRAAPKLAARFRAASLLPDATNGRQPAPNPDDAELKRHYGYLPLHAPDKRFSDPGSLVYTDGSKVDTSITGGVYQEGHQVQEKNSKS